MTRYDMAPEAPVGHQSALQIDGAPRAEHSQIRSPQGLGHDICRERAAVEVRHRQTHTIDCDRVAQSHIAQNPLGGNA